MALPFMAASSPDGPHFGVLARFADPKELYHACENVRDAGYTRWDAHTPFPVHGLEKAMGLPASPLPWLVLVLGLSGASGAMLMQWWVSTTAYALVISGKPFFSWQAFVPVTFEVGILLAALGAVFGMFALNQLPTLFHPLFRSKNFERFSDDAFFISIEAWDPKFDAQATADFLRKIGGVDIEMIASDSGAAS